MGSSLDKWLELAPAPWPLEGEQKWHVFLSYRSVHRPWLLQLYDILKHLKYEVFLDQYVLNTAAPLALSLGEGLDGSAAAIMVWSSDYKDSEWCRKELATLEAKENAGTGFRYLVTKLDRSPLTGLAAGKLWVDFSDQPEGPRGNALLRVLYGLAKKPLPPEAVKLATKVDEETSEALRDIRAGRLLGDWDRIIELSMCDSLAWASSPILGCQVADALIAGKEYPKAITVLNTVLGAFPKTVRAKQLLGLALARTKKWREAQFLLGTLYAAGELDTETLGIFARTWKDAYGATGNRLFLFKSRDLYRQAFDAAPKDYYTGINAATMSLLLDEPATAADLAAKVAAIVGVNPDPADYWKTATMAEAQLLQRQIALAGSLYAAAVIAAPAEIGSHESTYGQAKMILDHLKAVDDERKLVLSGFQHLAAASAAEAGKS